MLEFMVSFVGNQRLTNQGNVGFEISLFIGGGKGAVIAINGGLGHGKLKGKKRTQQE